MKYVAAILYAVSASVLLAIAFGFAASGLNPRLAACALTAGAVVGACSLLQRSAPIRWRTLTGMEWTAIAIFALFSLRAFLWLVFVDGDSVKVLSPNNLGDLSLHLTYIRFLANGAAFWPDNPIFAGGKLTYPVGMDLFNGLLSLAGVDGLRGLIWVGLGGCVCTGIALWRWRQTESGRRTSDAWLVRTMFIREFVLETALLNFTQILAVLLENGIPTAEALRLTERTVANRTLQAELHLATDRVLEGASLSASLTKTGFFPDLMLDRLAVGESTGKLAPSSATLPATTPPATPAGSTP